MKILKKVGTPIKGLTKQDVYDGLVLSIVDIEKNEYRLNLGFKSIYFLGVKFDEEDIEKIKEITREEFKEEFKEEYDVNNPIIVLTRTFRGFINF